MATSPTTAVQPQVPNSAGTANLKDTVDVLSRVVAVVFALLYAAGFLVVSIHDAMFGIVQFSFLKPRIFAAGGLCVVLTAVALVLARKVGLFQPKDSFVTGLSRTKEKVLWLMVLADSYFWACMFLAGGMSYAVLSANRLPPVPVSISVLYGVILVFSIATNTVRISQFHVKPIATASLAALDFTLLNLAVAYLNPSNYSSLVYWFFFAGLWAGWLHSELQNPMKRSRISWDIEMLGFLSVFIFFGTGLYDEVKPSFGGGAPTEVLLHLEKANPPLPQDSRVWLVDETETGFYVLRSRETKQAIFVPRPYVVGIEFGISVDKPTPPKH